MKYILTLLMLYLVVNTVQADALVTAEFGIEAGGSQIAFEDFEGEGDASTLTQVNALNAVLYAYIERDIRLKNLLGYRTLDIDSTETRLGQEGSLWTASVQYQGRFEFGRLAYFWAGLGLGMGLYDFRDRHKVDQDGFLSTAYKDLTGNTVSGLASINREFAIASSWLVGIGAQYEYHFNGRLSETSINLSLLYR